MSAAAAGAGKRKEGPLKARALTVWMMWAGRVKAERKRLQVLRPPAAHPLLLVLAPVAHPLLLLLASVARLPAPRTCGSFPRLSPAAPRVAARCSAALSCWLYCLACESLSQSALQVACRILDRSKVVEAFKRWLWFVDLQWDRRRMVESNMQNMALEFAIRKQKSGGSKERFY